MYEQAIKLLFDDATFCLNQMRLTQLRLDECPISAKYISLYNDWQARRKEMLEAIEVLKKDDRFTSIVNSIDDFYNTH